MSDTRSNPDNSIDAIYLDERTTVKDRIKKFYENHTTACQICLIVGAGVAAVVIAPKIKSRIGGNRPVSVDLWNLDGGGASMIVVNTKNGGSHQFVREVAEAVPAVAS